MKRYIAMAVGLTLLLTVGLAAAQGLSPTKIRQLMVDIDALIGRDLTVTDDATIGDDLTVTGDLGVTGDTTLTGDLTISGVLSGTVVTDGVLDEDLTVNGTLTATAFVGALTGDVTGNVAATTVTAATSVSTTAMIIAGQTQTGALHYGIVNPVTNGGVITHGFSVAPTACMVVGGGTAGNYYTATVGLLGATTFPVNMAAGDSGPVMWFCGK